jgi:prepilin-type processing-associated H-X9-DG protein
MNSNAFSADSQKDVTVPSEFLVMAPSCVGTGTAVFSGTSSSDVTVQTGLLVGCYKKQLFTNALYQDGHVSGAIVQTLNDQSSNAGKRRWTLNAPTD